MKLLIVGLLIVLFLILVYYLFKSSLSSNNVLNLINAQEDWGYYNGASLISPYVFKLGTNNSVQISYFDSLGGYLQGTVIFNATYQVVDVNNIKILPTSVVSTATHRWPSGQTWTLTYNSNTSLTLNNGTTNMSLIIT